MRRVDQQIEQNLVDLSGKAGHRREIRVKMGLNVGNVFPLTS